MFTLQRPRKGRKHYTVKIRLPGQPTRELSTQCERRGDARRVAERLHSEAATAQARITLLAALELWIGLKVRKRSSAETIAYTEEKCARLLAFFGPERNVLTLTLRDTTAYVELRRQTVTDSTIAKEMTQLRGALRYLARHGGYPRDPAALWPPELPHGSGKRDRWLTWEEYLRILAALPLEWRDHYVVYCATGLRFRELYYLSAQHVRGRVLDVPGTKTPKAVRTVPLNPDALEVLERRAQAAELGPLFHVTRKGGLKSQKAAWARGLRSACQRAKVGHASTNDLRRTFCSWCVQQGVAEHVASAWMGHGSAKLVREVYGRLGDQFTAEHAELIPSRLRFRHSDRAEEG